jgi:hypothetical protein
MRTPTNVFVTCRLRIFGDGHCACCTQPLLWPRAHRLPCARVEDACTRAPPRRNDNDSAQSHVAALNLHGAGIPRCRCTDSRKLQSHANMRLRKARIASPERVATVEFSRSPFLLRAHQSACLNSVFFASADPSISSTRTPHTTPLMSELFG